MLAVDDLARVRAAHPDSLHEAAQPLGETLDGRRAVGARIGLAHSFTGWANRIVVRTMLRFQAGLSVVRASAARALMRSVSTRSRVQPFASG